MHLIAPSPSTGTPAGLLRLCPLHGSKAAWLQLFCKHLQVYMAKLRQSTLVAVKEMLKQQTEKAFLRESKHFLREIKLLRRQVPGLKLSAACDSISAYAVADVQVRYRTVVTLPVFKQCL